MSRRSSWSKWRVGIQEEGGDFTERIVDSPTAGVEHIREYAPSVDRAHAQMIRLVWEGDKFVPYAPAEILWDVFHFEFDRGVWLPAPGSRLAWGLSGEVPWTAPAAWGCRAIDHGTTIDIVHDRTDFIGCLEQRDRLRGLLMEQVPQPRLEELVCGITERDTVLVVFSAPGIQVKARRAGGYFYIAAWATTT